jgi:DNA-directed RNA polymerase specialized sigma24 family protein
MRANPALTSSSFVSIRRHHDCIITRKIAATECTPPACLNRERFCERLLRKFACLASDFTASSTEKVNGAHPSNDHLRDVVSALPAAQRRLIEQLFWKERTEIEVANTMGINQSTINRRKHDILKGLRMKLRDRNEFQKFSA